MSVDKDWLASELNRARPDREDSDERAWLEPIIAKYARKLIADEGSAQLAIIDAARRQVRQYDGTLQRRANAVIRDAYKTGQWPLDWFELARLPVVCGGYRVALEALEPTDLETFADEEEKRANSEHEARMATVQGARSFAAEIRRKRGAKRLGDIVRVDS